MCFESYKSLFENIITILIIVVICFHNNLVRSVTITKEEFKEQ